MEYDFEKPWENEEKNCNYEEAYKQLKAIFETFMEYNEAMKDGFSIRLSNYEKMVSTEIKNIIKTLSDARKAYDTTSRPFFEKNFCDGIIQGLDIAIEQLTYCNLNKIA